MNRTIKNFFKSLFINLKEHNGDTQLIKVTIKNDIENVIRLLELGANPNIQDEFGWSPLMLASQENCEKGIKMLLKYKANIKLLNIYKTDVFDIATPLNKKVILNEERGRILLPLIYTKLHIDIIRLIKKYL